MDLSEHHPFRSAEAKAKFLASYDSIEKRWPVAWESRMVDTSYGQTYVRISGPEAAPLLVLLHGAYVTSLSWAPHIEALSQHYRTFAVDNIYDYGRSVYAQRLTNPGDFVTWLDELFNALALGSDINLMGLSYGGWLTSLYATRYPNRLAKVIIIAPGATVLPVSLKTMLRSALITLPPRYFARSFFSWMFADSLKNTEIGPAPVEEITDGVRLSIKSFKPMRVVMPTVLKDEELQSFKTPALFLVGENEKLYSAHKAVQRLNKLAPQIKTEILPNAGHDLTLIHTELVNRRVLEFLNQS
jgi:pimeloyl-ACP methyl ester carboxylesterase